MAYALAPSSEIPRSRTRKSSHYREVLSRERRLAALAIDSMRGCNADHFASDPSVYHTVRAYANTSGRSLHINMQHRNILHSDVSEAMRAPRYARERQISMGNSISKAVTIELSLRLLPFALGLLVETLVHPVVSHIGAFHPPLQLLLDHPRVTTVAPQQEQNRRGGNDRPANGKGQRQNSALELSQEDGGNFTT